MRWHLTTVGAALVACGGAPAADGGVDAGTIAPPDAGPVLSEPAAPALPGAGCPAGWIARTLEIDGVDPIPYCDPWEGEAPDCVAPEMALPGRPECVLVGGECPAGDLPDVTPSAAIHVVAGAAGGDGSRDAPFGTIAEAMPMLGEGGTLVLGRGTYREPIELPTRSTLIGSCARETTLEVALPGNIAPAIDVLGEGVVIRNLHVATDRDIGIRVIPDASALVSGVWVDGTDVAMLGFHGRLEVEDALVTDADTYGIQLENGLEAVVRRVAFVDVGETAFRVVTLATLDFEDVVVRGANDAELANPLAIFEQATVTARRLVLEDNLGPPIIVAGEGASLSLEDAVVRDPTRRAASGIRVLNGATLTLRRAHLSQLPLYALGAGEPGSRARIEDCLVERARGVPGRSTAAGLEVDDGAEATLARVAVIESEGLGVLVDDARLDAADLVVASTAPHAESLGRALQIQNGGAASVARTLLLRNHEASIVVSSSSTLEATDLRVAESLPRGCATSSCADYPAGSGVAAIGGSVRLERFVVEESALCGVQVARAGSIDALVGHVRRNAIGVCLQVPGYDVSRLIDRVLYTDNGSSIDATMFPVPDPASPTLP